MKLNKYQGTNDWYLDCCLEEAKEVAAVFSRFSGHTTEELESKIRAMMAQAYGDMWIEDSSSERSLIYVWGEHGDKFHVSLSFQLRKGEDSSITYFDVKRAISAYGRWLDEVEEE